MAEFSKLVVTRKGQALIAKILAGTATDIDFVSVAASDASYSVDELEGLESLSAIMQESEISRKTRTNEVAVKVETAFSNTDLTVGYHMRTLGLFANDPDEGKILYAATVETSGNCYMPPYNGITVSGAYIQLITTVGNADNVSLEVNPGAIATIGDIQQLQKQIDELVARPLGVTFHLGETEPENGPALWFHTGTVRTPNTIEFVEFGGEGDEENRPAMNAMLDGTDFITAEIDK